MALILKDEAALGEFAQLKIGEWKNGAVVGLHGELGAGKTTFVRLFIERLCKLKNQPMPRILSPSFVLHQSYEELDPCVDHFDWYRLDRVAEQDLIESGFWDAVRRVEEQKGFIFVEWAERLAELSPAHRAFTHHLKFTVDAKGVHSVE